MVFCVICLVLVNVTEFCFLKKMYKQLVIVDNQALTNELFLHSNLGSIFNVGIICAKFNLTLFFCKFFNDTVQHIIVSL